MENQENKHIRIYRKASKGRHKPVWFCAACCDPYFAIGKFHGPVYVPAADLDGVCCAICGKVVSK